MAGIAHLAGWIERCLRTAALALSIVLLVVLATICLCQVVARFVLLQPTPWTEGLASGAMLWAVFLSLPAAFHVGAMVSVTLYENLPRRYHLLFHILAAAGSCLVLGLAAFYGIKLIELVKYQKLSGVGVSMAWLYASVPTGCILAIPTVLRRFAAELRGQQVVEDNLEVHV